MIEEQIKTPEVIEKQKINVCCLLGFIFSIISILAVIPYACKVGVVGIILSAMAVVGLILSIIGVAQTKKKPQGLKKLGIAGIVLSCVGIIIFLVMLFLAFFTVGIVVLIVKGLAGKA